MREIIPDDLDHDSYANCVGWSFEKDFIQLDFVILVRDSPFIPSEIMRQDLVILVSRINLEHSAAESLISQLQVAMKNYKSCEEEVLYD